MAVDDVQLTICARHKLPHACSIVVEVFTHDSSASTRACKVLVTTSGGTQLVPYFSVSGAVSRHRKGAVENSVEFASKSCNFVGSDIILFQKRVCFTYLCVKRRHLRSIILTCSITTLCNESASNYLRQLVAKTSLCITSFCICFRSYVVSVAGEVCKECFLHQVCNFYISQTANVVVREDIL